MKSHEGERIVKSILPRLRRICLALPEAEETRSFGHPTFRAGKKTFVVLEEYRGELAICFKATVADQALLTMDPKFYVAPYIGKHGWTSLRVESPPDWNEVADLVHTSYRLVATKHMLRTLEADGAARTRRK